MAIVWYILIHVSLGLIGYEVFTFTNLGALYCAAAASVVQGYAVYEIHKLAKPRFDAAFVGTKGVRKTQGADARVLEAAGARLYLPGKHLHHSDPHHLGADAGSGDLT